MTFLEIQDAVLADAFDETKRADAKVWIRARHALLWDLEEWTFRFKTASVVFTADSQVLQDFVTADPSRGGRSIVTPNVPADFRAAIALYTSDGQPVAAVEDLGEFFDRYNANLTPGSGAPQVYTVVGDDVLVYPLGDGSTGLLVYECSKPDLTLDDDATGLPDGYDMALVHGAKATGMKLGNVPLAADHDAEFAGYANGMRRSHLSAIRAQGARQLGAYRP